MSMSGSVSELNSMFEPCLTYLFRNLFTSVTALVDFKKKVDEVDRDQQALSFI